MWCCFMQHKGLSIKTPKVAKVPGESMDAQSGLPATAGNTLALFGIAAEMIFIVLVLTYLSV